MQLHEQTQRTILLLIFYLFGPILTLGIIGSIVLRKLPSNTRHWEQSLLLQTGLHWKIGSVEYRTPNFTRLHNIEILDENTRRTIFKAAYVDIKRITDSSREKVFPGILTDSDNKKSTGLTSILENTFPSLCTSEQFWQISVPVSALDLGEYPGENSAALVQNLLQKVFARFNTFTEVPVQIVLDQVGVRSGHSLQRGEDQLDIFHSIQGNFYRTRTELRSDWSFQIRGVSDLDWEHRERLSFTLSLTDTLEISFLSGRQPIPCDLAAVFCAPFRNFSGGTFQGKFSHSIRSGRAETQATRLEYVIFRNVPLTPLISSYTTFDVEGTIAELRFSRATLSGEDFYAEGSLHVVDGSMERALFHSCVDRFDLRVEPEEILVDPASMVRFSACAVFFRLQPGGIDFWADQRWHNAILHYLENIYDPKSKLIVFLPERRRPVTYLELMSIFAPASAPLVPLTPGLQSIVPLIPIQ